MSLVLTLSFDPRHYREDRDGGNEDGGCAERLTVEASEDGQAPEDLLDFSLCQTLKLLLLNTTISP